MRTLLVRVIRFFVPWLIRIFWWIVNLATLSLASIWVGVPQSIDRITDDWVKNAKTLGVPEKHLWLVQYPSTLIALTTLLLGWIILAYVTVWFVNLLLLT